MIGSVARTAALAALIGAACIAGTAGTAQGWAGSANTEPAENASPAGTPSAGGLSQAWAANHDEMTVTTRSGRLHGGQNP
jgi:hypothetical protein